MNWYDKRTPMHLGMGKAVFLSSDAQPSGFLARISHYSPSLFWSPFQSRKVALGTTIPTQHTRRLKFMFPKWKYACYLFKLFRAVIRPTENPAEETIQSWPSPMLRSIRNHTKTSTEWSWSSFFWLEDSPEKLSSDDL